MRSHRLVRALACASLVTLAALPVSASAQQIKRIIAFGDSYADTGNFLRLAGINPITTQIYTTGRFSGGSNYVDTLSTILNVPQYNFAIGGAHTDNGNQTAGFPGLTFEVQEFASGGGTLGFPTLATSLARSDLVVVSIGGNDARSYQLSGGTLAGAPAAAATAVANTQANLNVVMAHGTPTISFFAGNTALLPEIANNPSGAAIRNAYSTTYDSGVQQVLARYAAQGSIVHYLDGTAVLQEISGSPSTYGLQGIVCPAVPDPTCIANSNAPYLFYVDYLHLTSAGFAIVGQYIARQLAAPLTLQAPSDLGLDVAREWGRTLSSRGDLYGRGKVHDGLHLYALGDALQHGVAATDWNSAFDVRSIGGTIGAEFGAGGALAGIAGNYSRPTVNFGNDSARVKAHSWQVGVYGSVAVGGLFGQAYLGYGKDHDRITRTGVVQPMAARPGGSHSALGAKGGYLVQTGPFALGPIVALDYAHAKIDAYSESGDPALTLSVGRQSVKALTGQAGAEVRSSIAGLHPFVDLTIERNFTGDGQLITFNQTDAPVIVNSWLVPRRKDTYGRLAGGASAEIVGRVSLDAFVSTTVGRSEGQEVAGNLGVKARF